MKKILLILALAASVQVANAQGNKNAAAAMQAYEAAQKAADDAKKNTKAATWVKLGQTCLEAYQVPAGALWIGAQKSEVALLLNGQRPSSTEAVTIAGQNLTKETYRDKNVYYSENGKLLATEVTQPILAGALDKAFDAFKKAAELDTKAQQSKQIVAGISSVQARYLDEAYNAYSLAKYAESSKFFEKVSEASGVLPGSTVDAESIYNAGFTSWLGQDWARAKEFFNKSIDAGYFGENGEVYAKLADVASKMGNEEESKNYLETGFSKFPQSQSVLVGLINYYVAKGEDTNRLFELLDVAKKNEPTNASLYYVEGNIRDKLGDFDAALAAYDKCSTINPDYEYGYIGKGVMLCTRADSILEKANSDNTLTQAQYDAQLEEYYKLLKDCVAPFEKAFELSKDASVKQSIASYLKNVCFRFREESPEYLAKYEKYSKAAAE